MIIVKVELHSAIDKTVRELAQMRICNTGTGTEEYGDYSVELLKRGTNEVYRKGFVTGHKRLKLSVWILVVKALGACFPDWRVKV